jgi:hypothetical protein
VRDDLYFLSCFIIRILHGLCEILPGRIIFCNCIPAFRQEILKERRHLEDFYIIWKNTIKKDPKEIRWKIVKWVYLSQKRDKLRSVMNMLMNNRLP